MTKLSNPSLEDFSDGEGSQQLRNTDSASSKGPHDRR
jgi:hypothetical protein